MAKKHTKVNVGNQFKPPVVAVMGHVDHGKTTLLDYIRKSRVAHSEHGNITQHIGAYQALVGDKAITFIDTPGHEAFKNLRSRGASVADIALLVIDATESVKPQTVESIKIIQESKLPLIVVMNKMDLPNANADKVKKDLLRHNIQVEEHGGKISAVPVSAQTGKGVNDLLDAILLVAEFKDITADPGAKLTGVVIEAQKVKGRGSVGTVIVQSGTLKAREEVVVGSETVKIRALFDDAGKSIRAAYPGQPVEVMGFSNLPTVGSVVTRPGQESPQQSPSHVDNQTQDSIDSDEEAVLVIYLKADTHGSLEAIEAGLPETVQVVKTDIGDVTEGDVTYAKTTKSVIIGFNVKVSSSVKKLAKDEKVQMRTYTIIYKLFDEVSEVAELLSQGPQRELIGQAKVEQVFETSDGVVAGCQITDGRVARGDKVLLVRNDEIIKDTKITSLRVQKDEVNKVEKGKMCGILLGGEVDIVIGDMIQSYTLYEF